MTNRKVFIGWNGKDNQLIAQLVSNRLSHLDYSPIVGGEWRKSLTISEDIIHEMDCCDFAIILIEKETRKDKNGKIISMGFNPNVMMELGYMLHKVTDHQRIRRILINVKSSELPSDLQGAWTIEINKPDCSNMNEDEKLAVLSNVADTIVNDFFNYMKSFKQTDKLDYFDNWEETMLEVNNYDGNTRISEKLIYGLQISTYTGDYEKLYRRLIGIRQRLTRVDKMGDYAAVSCALAIIEVFVLTQRLTRPLSEDDVDTLEDKLKQSYEDTMDDDLKTWCRVFRTDKLELCYENFAQNSKSKSVKLSYYKKSLRLCQKVLDLIDDYIASSSTQESSATDENYALLYKSYATRNIFQIYKQLSDIEPEKAEEYLKLQEQYCKLSYQYRKALYTHYKGSKRENSISMDFISQEYLLSLAEVYQFERDEDVREDIEETAHTIYRRWQKRNRIRNMIFNKVQDSVKGQNDFLFGKEEQE